MKKFLTCALCFVPTLAVARTLYYTPGGECPGLYLNPATTGCPGDSDRVVKLNVAKRADANFSGYKIGNVEIVDSAGNVKDNAVNTLAAARNAGTITDAAKISGYECNQGIYGSNKNVQKNENGTCVVENSDEDSGVEYIRGDGTPESPSNVNCWRNGKNYCYWNVNITFHSKPANDTTVTGINDPNNGQLLTSKLKTPNSNWCYEYAGTGENTYCARIHMPTSPNYQFRGYYLGKVGNQTVTLPNDVITDHSTTDGGAFSVFYPKNIATNNDNISITEHTIVVMSDTPVETDASINVDLYGAWARKCTDESTCRMEVGTLWNVTNGLGKGDVRYNNFCPNGYHVQSGTNGYNPTCERDTGDMTVKYNNFINQYNETVNLTATTETCVSGDNYNLLSKSDFTSAYGAGAGTLYWLNTNGEYYSPNRSVMCSTNVFGTSPANVTGYVCDATCNDGAATPEHGTCVSIEPTVIYYDPVGQGHTNGTLWESGGVSCKKLKCESGYVVWTENGRKICKDEYEACIASGKTPEQCGLINFSCPTSLTAPSGVTVSVPQQNDYQCTYNIECSDSGAVLEHPNPGTVSPTARGGVLACNGTSGCTQQQVQSALNQYSCFKCMSTGFAYDTTLTVGAPTMAPNGVASSHSCSYNVWCRTGQYANQDPVGTVTCYSNDNNGQTPCRTPVGTTYYYNITELINHYVDSCSGTTPPVLDSCPTMSGNTGGPEGNPSSWGTVNVAMTGTPANGCTYTLSCANNYTLVKQNGGSYTTVENGTTTVTCSNSACNTGALSPQIGSYYCRSNLNSVEE